MVFRNINWSGGVNIDGEWVTHLRLADDIVLVSCDTTEAEKMLHELDQQGKTVGLKINVAKTKLMQSDGLRGTTVRLNDILVEVESFVYLGQAMNMRHSMEEELNRRCRYGWVACNSIKEILANLNDPAMHAHLFNSIVLSSVLYGRETWSLTKKEEQRLTVAERAMERRILNVTLSDHVRNEEIRRIIQFRDVIEEFKRSKYRWAEHTRLSDNR
ncbi:hypothetical protein AB6A40_007119 [Gnathostoma spinigerum]|uniref:Reverse transcriptase domain-containing protein n=1 Tax=Gnathostoma spinigerum TaxID=75299 RepID=A0ABD6ELI6_9BILA